MKLKRQLFTGILGLATLCGCLGAFIFSNSHIAPTHADAVSEEHDHSNWTPITSLPNQPGSYYLTDDIYLDSYAWTVPQGSTNLCLNGHFIRKHDSTSNTDSLIRIGTGSTLNIYECDSNYHYYYYNSNNSLIFKPISEVHDDAKTLEQFESFDELRNEDYIKIPGGGISGGWKTDNGYGAGILVDGANAYLNLYGGNIVGNYCANYGGGVAVKAGGTFTMEGGNIVGNKSAYDGGGVTSQEGGNFIFKGGKICFNKGNLGGGIVVRDGTFTMEGGFISSNIAYSTSGSNGGGIRVNQYGHATINGGTISHNKSQLGAGIYIDGDSNSKGEVAISGGTISSNNAGANGGGIYNAGTTLITAGTIKGNSCGNGSSGRQIYSAYQNGVVLDGYCNIDSGNNDLWYVNVDNAKTKLILNNQGGSKEPEYVDVYFYKQIPDSVDKPTRTGYSFVGYFTGENGAGTQYYDSNGNRTYTSSWTSIIAESNLYAHWLVNHVHDNILFLPWTSNNSLPTTAGNYYLTGDVNINSTWAVPNGTTNLCLNGYVIKVPQANEKYSVINVNNGAILNIYDCNNLSKHYFQYRTDTCWRYQGSTTSESFISLADVNENTSNGTIVEVYGGCITGTYSWEGQHGGGVSVTNNSKLNLYGGNIIGNSTFNSDGGGIYAGNNSSINIAGGNVIGNVGTFGGGICIADSSSLSMSSGSVSHNNAWSGKGGGVLLYNDASSFNFSGGTISYNVANRETKGFGGGVYIACPTFTMSGDALITHNRTNGVGGGVYVEGNKTFTMNDGSITYNTAGTDGGGVDVDGQFIMFDGNIDYNTAGQYGGGIRSTNTSYFEIKKGSVSHNTTTLQGGGICANGRFTINDATIEYNHAGTDGGGIHTWTNNIPSSSDPYFVISGNTSISYNTCVDNGGGIHHANNNGAQRNMLITGNVIISHNISTGNGTANGGGIWSNSTFTLDGGTISYNEVRSTANGCGCGGGVWVGENSSFLMNDGVISNNTAKRYGGGVQVKVNSSFTMNAGSIIINIASTNGGGGINADGTVVIKNAKINGNYCGSNEGHQIRRGGSSIVAIREYCTIDNGANDLYNVTNDTTKTKFVLNNEDGTESKDYIDAIYNQRIPNLTAIPTKTGYTFNGYYTGFNGTGTKYYNADGGRAFTNNWNTIIAEINLYAYWTANSYTVSLDSQGGTGGTSTVTATFDASMPPIALPTRDYCDFGGYFTEANGKGTRYHNSDGTSARNWDIDSNTTLYAYWTKSIENFAKEFLDKTNNKIYCEGSLDQSIKNDLIASFKLVDSEGIAAFKNAEWIRGQVEILDDVVNAKSRYCYMVIELGIDNHDDFLDIFDDAELKALMHRGSIVSLFNDGENGTSVILVASLSILAITTISAYILFRKRKEE